MNPTIKPAKRVGPKGCRVCSFCRRTRCRPARPQCKAMRKVQPQRRPCDCGGSHYPHRVGSNVCVSHPQHAELKWAEIMKPVRRSA